MQGGLRSGGHCCGRRDSLEYPGGGIGIIGNKEGILHIEKERMGCVGKVWEEEG